MIYLHHEAQCLPSEQLGSISLLDGILCQETTNPSDPNYVAKIIVLKTLLPYITKYIKTPDFPSLEEHFSGFHCEYAFRLISQHNPHYLANIMLRYNPLDNSSFFS